MTKWTFDPDDRDRGGYSPAPPWWYFQMMQQNQQGPSNPSTMSVLETIAKQRHDLAELERFFKKEEKAKKTLGLSERDMRWVLAVSMIFFGMVGHAAFMRIFF